MGRCTEALTLHFTLHSAQFLVQMHIMDYSLLLGIHDVERAEMEEEEEEKEEGEEGSAEEEEEQEEEEEEENGLAPGPTLEGPAGYTGGFKPPGPGEYDPYMDVYAIQSAEGRWRRRWSGRTPG